MDKTDIVIIGAGVVGLAICRGFALQGREVVLVERNSTFGQETSSRNSEVIHGGMYYPTGSLKAALCVRGREMLYGLCGKYGIPHKKTGKLIVAVEPDEIPALEALKALGEKNGVKGLSILDKKEVERIEPNIFAVAALFSPETGIIDSHRLMQFFLDCAREKGALVAFNSEVTGIEKAAGGYTVRIKNGSESIQLRARTIINCAGLDSDTIASCAGMDIRKYQYELHYCKGQYFRIRPNKANLIKGLVYPVPKPKAGGLGIHATIDLAGSVRLGPDDKYLPVNIKDYSLSEERRKDFLSSALKFMPFLDEQDIFADSSGIRPKLQPPGGEFRDFVIREESDKGFPNFVNLIGIESPGLTASCAIADWVSSMPV